MFINELPDKCLLIVFGLINELDDLVNCYKVCNKWSLLIAERAKKVEYLVDIHALWPIYGTWPNITLACVYYRSDEPIDATFMSTLFPNLMIGDFSFVKYKDMVTLGKEIKSLKGLIYQFHGEDNQFCAKDKPIFQYFDQLEMISPHHIMPCMEKSGANIKQLHLWLYTLDKFKRDAHYFPNLERLSIDKPGCPDGYYDGPILRKLKILELSSSWYGTAIYYGFQFMDSCPNLQSAHIKFDCSHIFVDESIKHTSLRDLVLTDDSDDFRVYWVELKSLLKKYPNLKHLALVGYTSLEDYHVEQLVGILPNLVLFTVLGCSRVTQKAASYVREYAKLRGRSIKFYFHKNRHKIKSDWPHLSTKRERIGFSFDFMKHCFLKDFDNLPNFLLSK